MNEYLKKLVSSKNVLILGFGREGRSTLKKLMEIGGYRSVTISDMKDVSKDVPEGVLLVFGERYLDVIDDYDVVFKAPGVVLPKEFSEYKAYITSEVEVFMSVYRDNIIGITGTKGKSTTSSFLNHLLKTANKPVLFAGNIGIPVFEIAAEVKADSVIVLELSCHQLEFTRVSPKRAILLNVYEDHLDHYGTREKYGLAKKNIYKFQKAGDVLYTIKEVTDEWGEAVSEVRYVGREELPFNSFEEIETSFRGEHNLGNVAFAYAVAGEFGVNSDNLYEALKTFETLPHRLEYVGKFNEIEYYDDSISTTVKSCISAVESIKNSAILLVGGMERNIDYTELAEYLADSKLKYIVCMYESGKRFYAMYEEKIKAKAKGSFPEAILVENLTEAVKISKEKAKSGDAVILSPAAASYGYFKNFEERGDVFKNLVKNEF